MKATITANGKSVDIELTDEQAKTLGIEEKKKTGWERVQPGNQYYFIAYDCSLKLDFENSDTTDEESYKSGNYFSDFHLGEKMAKRVSLMLRMQRWADEHNDKIDWTNMEQQKYHIYYDEEIHDFVIGEHTYVNTYEIWFSSEELAEKALEIFGEEIKETYID